MILYYYYLLLIMAFGISTSSVALASTPKSKLKTVAAVSQSVRRNPDPRRVAIKLPAISPYILEALDEAAEEAGIAPPLLKSICFVESGLRPHAFVHSDGGDQNHAFGICQILRSTGQQLLKRDAGCYRDFTDPNLARVHKNCSLFGPRVNATAAARYLRMQINRYGGSIFKGVAAYNSGSLRLCRSGWVTNRKGQRLYRCQPGDLLNRTYLHRVEAMLPYFGGSRDLLYTNETNRYAGS